MEITEFQLKRSVAYRVINSCYNCTNRTLDYCESLGIEIELDFICNRHHHRGSEDDKQRG
jgi:hypothetical protein